MKGLAYLCVCGFSVEDIESGDALMEVMRGHRLTHGGLNR